MHQVCTSALSKACSYITHSFRPCRSLPPRNELLSNSIQLGGHSPTHLAILNANFDEPCSWISLTVVQVGSTVQTTFGYTGHILWSQWVWTSCNKARRHLEKKRRKKRHLDQAFPAQQMSQVIHEYRCLSCAIASRASGTWQTTRWSAQTLDAPLALAGHWQIASCPAVVLMASAGIQAWLQSPFGGQHSKWTFQVQHCLAAGKFCTKRFINSLIAVASYALFVYKKVQVYIDLNALLHCILTSFLALQEIVSHLQQLWSTINTSSLYITHISCIAACLQMLTVVLPAQRCSCMWSAAQAFVQHDL